MKFAIDEVLRYDSPFQSFFRTTGAGTVFRGIPIPADTKIVLFLGSATGTRRSSGRTPVNSASSAMPPA
ncbi:hypothetical protein [Arthrobacter crystallopoietes]|uniref:hypothetical protein n=1 Tax=Crystallibacter crystallopoietes TaxID=37928 RepID=UPI001FCD2631|nr:hypothetical protein [Arthrobacter crystallopoietes]